MRHAATRELFGYWNRLRGHRNAPRRDEVEPSDIRLLLSDTFILEVSGALKTISYRLAGTRICAIFGRELKGYGYLGHWSERDSFDIARVLARVYRDFEPVLVVMRGTTDSGKQADFEVLLLPLEPMPDGSARIIGMAVSEKDQFWLGTEPITECTIRSARSIDPADGQESPGENWKANEAPPLSPQLTPPDGVFNYIEAVSETVIAPHAKKVRHLTVHEGGKE
ncbi:PAS domain-containing protein [Salaquimonas pukyongi]|uniref:PAS domain-containing protein n=1 Tax=Salaquimonas pukyongi TaxID=2712698 RepID=UPI00096B89AB|nr:PAS domain-containing protein [Salaquimonas pukyongi]